MAAQLQRQLKPLETDNSRMRDEIKRSHDQIAFVKQENALELRRAADREAALRKELLEALSQATTASDKVSGYRKRWMTLAIGIAAPAMIWAGVTILHSGGGHDASPGDAVVAESASPQPTAKSSKPAARDLAAGLGRLDQALDSFKGQKPEDVLQRIHLQNAARGISVCSFDWNNGDPSLEFGAKEGMNLDASLSTCADAVEKATQ